MLNSLLLDVQHLILTEPCQLFVSEVDKYAVILNVSNSLQQRRTTNSVEVFYASSCKAGSYLRSGHNGGHRMPIAHWLAQRHYVRNNICDSHIRYTTAH